MEVIFDTTNLRPVLSPTMRTTLSVISLIANSLIEANKCMKERLADETGQVTTLDQVMQQSGLRIPGLEEALQADEVVDTNLAAPDTADTAVAMVSPAAISDTAVADAAAIVAPPATAHDTAEAVAVAATAAPPSDTSAEESLPPAATAEEVVEAIGLIEQFAVETQAAEAEQLTRIAAAEEEVARMRSLIQSARQPRGDAQAHA